MSQLSLKPAHRTTHSVSEAKGAAKIFVLFTNKTTKLGFSLDFNVSAT